MDGWDLSQTTTTTRAPLAVLKTLHPIVTLLSCQNLNYQNLTKMCRARPQALNIYIKSENKNVCQILIKDCKTVKMRMQTTATDIEGMQRKGLDGCSIELRSKSLLAIGER